VIDLVIASCNCSPFLLTFNIGTSLCSGLWHFSIIASSFEEGCPSFPFLYINVPFAEFSIPAGRDTALGCGRPSLCCLSQARFVTAQWAIFTESFLLFLNNVGLSVKI
jgi:hypothetical protein